MKMTVLNERQLAALKKLNGNGKCRCDNFNSKTLGGLYNRGLVVFTTISPTVSLVEITEKGIETLQHYGK